MKLDNLIEEYTLNKPAIEVVEKEKQEYRYLGSLRRIPGHRLFSFNRRTFEIKEIKPEVIFTYNSGKGRTLPTSKVNVEPGCYYDQALNKKNFIKRLIRNGIIIRKT